MTLEDQIRDLERQSRAEMRNMTLLYARTKRDVQRSLSPDRVIRKNIGAAMLLAGIGGMLIAPAPRYAGKNGTHPARRPQWLRAISGALPHSLRKFMGVDSHEGQPAQTPGPDHKRSKSLTGLLLAEVLTLAAQRINWAALLPLLIERFRMSRGKSAMEPKVAVADIGTTRSDRKLDGDI